MRVQTRALKSRELADRANMDGTTSSSNVDSLRVIAALRAGESQRLHCELERVSACTASWRESALALQAKKKNRKLTCVVRATSPTRTVSVRAR